MISILGLLGLSLAMTGLYGMLACLVAQRMREFVVASVIPARRAAAVDPTTSLRAE